MRFRWVDVRLLLVCSSLIAAASAVSLTALDVRHSMSSAGLGYPHADRLVTLVAGSKSWSPAMLELGSVLTAFESLAGIQERSARVQFEDRAEIVRLESVSSTYFELLGIAPATGRVFDHRDDRRNGQVPVAVISDRLWRTRFSARADVIGRPLVVDDRALQVIGVLHPGGGLIGRTDVWTPLGSARWLNGDTGPERPSSRWFEVFGRLAPSVSVEQASSQLADVLPGAMTAAGLPAGSMLGNTPRFSVRLLSDTRVPPLGRQVLAILVWAAAALSLFVVVTLASVLRLRAHRNAHGLSVQLALGAGARHVLRPAAFEGLTAGAVGVAFALVLHPLLTAGIASIRPSATSFGIVTANWLEPAAAFSLPVFALLSATVAACIAISMAVAALSLHRARRDPLQRSEAPGGLSRVASPAVWLLSVQTAFACAVLGGAVLMATALGRVLERDRGYDSRDVLTARIDLPDDYDLARTAAFHERLLDRLGATPHLVSSSVSTCAPGAGRCRQSNISRIDGVAIEGHAAPQVGVHIVSSGHFATIGAEISRGRSFSDADDARAPATVVITDELAASLWPGVNPVGRQLEVYTANGSLNGLRTVAGTVRPIRFSVDADRGLDVYLPVAQVAASSVMVFLKTGIGEREARAVLENEVSRLDARIPVHDVMPLAARLSNSLATEQLLTSSLFGFAGVALILAIVGTYTMTKQAVASAQRELAIRLALGATAGRVGRLVATRAGLVAIVGAVTGTAMAFGGARVLGSLLHGTPQDDLIMLVSPLIVVFALALSLIGPVRLVGRVNVLLAMKGG